MTVNRSRRNFIKRVGLIPGLLLLPKFNITPGTKLGRVNVGMAEVKRRPDPDSTTVARVYQDTVVSWLREVVGRRPYRFNQRWVETPDGYIWAPYLQPVQNQLNSAVKTLPNTSLGSGMWAEVTVPFVDCLLDNPPARSPWLQDTSILPRLYYS